MGEESSQIEVFNDCQINEMVDSALEGYSATIFAYGQTGSGKTYSMAGREERLGVEGWSKDDTDGIIPRAVEYMWEQMTLREE
jgi:kinesin family protein 12